MLNRREFLRNAAGTVAVSWMPRDLIDMQKVKIAIVGTGSRGIGMWGRPVAEKYGTDLIEIVGLCDLNPGRLEYARQTMGVNCPVYLHTDFEKMIKETKPDQVVVTTPDATHHEYIIKSMLMGCDVIAEKPLTTDKNKVLAIIDAQSKTGRNVTSTFNVRYMPIAAELKRLLMEERVGRITSVDFHWYLDINHGASYFRRWHRKMENSGSLLLQKASHHFDVLNWWLDSDPEEVFGYGNLEYYGKNNQFRSDKCRGCGFKDRCIHFWDITKDQESMDLYVAHEKYDGYLRDGCVWKEDIDIYDKMAVQMKYANGVQVSYSLTTYSPYEGFRVAFNGLKGRIETWVHHQQPWPMDPWDEIRITDNFGETNLIKVPLDSGDHGGADDLIKERIFEHPDAPDPLGQSAGLRDGIMAVLIGIGARNSIESGQPVRIADLSPVVPQVKRPPLI